MSVEKAHISYLRRSEIDIHKWDQCITDSPNGLIYAYSWFLDGMADNWDALIMGDYEAVMPLPWRKKWGIYYIYQPALIQRLGIFSKQPLSKETSERLISAVFSRFKWLDYNVNFNINASAASINYLLRTNYILPLNHAHGEIYNNYSQACKKNLNKAYKRQCHLTNSLSARDVTNFYKKAYSDKLKKYALNYKRVEMLIEEAIKRGHCFLLGVNNTEKQLCQASAFFLSHNRIYYLFGAPNEKGRGLRATYFLINKAIEKYSNSEYVLDFEGSDIPSVAHFYQQFNPQKETYYNLKVNNLPFPLSLIKKHY